jgi:hypothetical protein
VGLDNGAFQQHAGPLGSLPICRIVSHCHVPEKQLVWISPVEFPPGGVKLALNYDGTGQPGRRVSTVSPPSALRNACGVRHIKN